MEGILSPAAAEGTWASEELPGPSFHYSMFNSYPGLEADVGGCAAPFAYEMTGDVMNVNGCEPVPSSVDGNYDWRLQNVQQQQRNGQMDQGLSHGLSLHLRDGLKKSRDIGNVPFPSEIPDFDDQAKMMTRDFSLDGDCASLPLQYGVLGDGPSNPSAGLEQTMDYRQEEGTNELIEPRRYQVTSNKHHLAQSSMCTQYHHTSPNESIMYAKHRFDQLAGSSSECHSPWQMPPEPSRNFTMANMCEAEAYHNEMSRMSNLSEMNCNSESFSMDLDVCDYSTCDPLDSVLERLKEESQYRNDAPVVLEEPDDWYCKLIGKDLHRPHVRSLDLCLPDIKHEEWPGRLPLGINEGVFPSKHKSGVISRPRTNLSLPEGESSSDQSCVTIKHEPRDSPKTPNSSSHLLKDITQKSRSKTSEYTGVSKHKKSGRWEVHIWLSDLGRQVYLGGYDDVVAAAEAYDIVQLRSRGLDAKTNFSIAKYKKRLETVMSLSLQELISDVRRSSKGFSRGVSNFRGVTRNPNGRWEARIGAYGSRHVYLGLYSHEKEAAIHYDRALVRLRGQKSATNFPLGDYKDALEQHMRISQELGNISVVSLGRIPVVKPHFELFLKFGGQETDSLIAAVTRMDGRTHTLMSKKTVRQKIACRQKCFSRDCEKSILHGDASTLRADDL